MDATVCGKMDTAKVFLERYNVIIAENVDCGFQSGNPIFPFFFSAQVAKRFSLMNQKDINAAVVTMRIFLAGLALNFDANFHELEEITRRALGAVESGVVAH